MNMLRRRSQSTKISPTDDTVDEDGNFSEEMMKDLRSAFGVFDVQNKGSLEKDDICNILEANNLTLPKETINLLVDRIDVDKNGTLEFEEFTLMMKEACNPNSGLPNCVDNFVEASRREIMKAKKARLKQFSNVSDLPKSIEDNPAAVQKKVELTKIEKTYNGKTPELINTGSKQFWRHKTRVDYNLHMCEELLMLQLWCIDSQKVFPEIWINKPVVSQQLAMEAAANMADMIDKGDGSIDGKSSVNSPSVKRPSGRETFGGGRGSVLLTQDFAKEEHAKLGEYVAKRIKFQPEEENSNPGAGHIEISVLTNDTFTLETLLMTADKVAEVKATGIQLPQPELHTVTTSEDIVKKIDAVNDDITRARRNSAAGEEYTKLMRASLDTFKDLYSKLNKRKERLAKYSIPRQRWITSYIKVRNILRRNAMVDLVKKYYPDSMVEKQDFNAMEMQLQAAS